MRFHVWAVGVGFLFLTGVVWGEGLPSLEELREASLSNNISLRVKQDELASIESQESFFNNVRAVSSYNFETDTFFYGLSLSIPFGFFSNRGKYLRYKRVSLEEAKRDLVSQVEDTYSEYEVLSKEVEIYEVKLKKARLKYKLAKEDFKHDRIERCNLIEAEEVFRRAEFEVFKIKHKIRDLKYKLCRLAGMEYGKAD